MSSLGDFLITGSHDRSMRRWNKTDETFFLEEEKEKRLERMLDADPGKTGSQQSSVTKDGSREVVAAPGQVSSFVWYILHVQS